MENILFQCQNKEDAYMNINWTQPITVYELIAIALSTIALIIPLIKYIYNHFIKKLKVDFLPSGNRDQELSHF